MTSRLHQFLRRLPIKMSANSNITRVVKQDSKILVNDIARSKLNTLSERYYTHYLQDLEHYSNNTQDIHRYFDQMVNDNATRIPQEYIYTSHTLQTLSQNILQYFTESLIGYRISASNKDTSGIHLHKQYTTNAELSNLRKQQEYLKKYIYASHTLQTLSQNILQYFTESLIGYQISSPQATRIPQEYIYASHTLQTLSQNILQYSTESLIGYRISTRNKNTPCARLTFF
ncbi:hypothetical protein E3Q10_00838 [Wallemia mellicola]|uniref:Uncharacterized protein n=2 Tax=Wallemia mellicola TaxID=1708541 RepID=A0A4T0R6K1_9BASI|nr:hypothetical protein E3Q10_00838 [Wallemia mellicola]